MFKNLFEEHKAERRGRILAAARRLIARGGWERLNMRDLAVAARVSVPTVYNLVGGKAELLRALVEQQFADAATAFAAARAGGTVADRAAALCEAGHRVLLEAPAYTRELVHLFLTAEDAAPVRRMIDERNVELMTALLTAGQQAGELEPWVDVHTVARALYMIYVGNLIRWAKGELDDAGLRRMTALGSALVLLGVTRGPARARLEAAIVSNQKEVQHVEPQRVAGRRHASRSTRR